LKFLLTSWRCRLRIESKLSAGFGTASKTTPKWNWEKSNVKSLKNDWLLIGPIQEAGFRGMNSETD
jgi:hypothetical protein